MRFQYLGTAAAEGWPAVFCRCPYCQAAEAAGGKNIRTRSQSLINDDLLLDLPADTYLHKLQFGLNLSKIAYLFITHSHSDHFYPQELHMHGPVFSTVTDCPTLHLYGSERVLESFQRCTQMGPDNPSGKTLVWHVLKAFVPVQAGPYRVVPLPARHMGKEEDAFLYHITDPDGKVVYYLHDTGYPLPEVWDYWKTQTRANLISLDATCGEITVGHNGTHMGVPDVLEVIRQLRETAVLGEGTRCVLNHFSHNGHLLHDGLCRLAAQENAEVAYDGMVLQL